MHYKLTILLTFTSIFYQTTVLPSIDKNTMYEWFHNPEHIMIELDPTQTLIQYGDNPRYLEPLDYAIEMRNYEAAALLVDYTENVNVRANRNYGETPLFMFFHGQDTEQRIRKIEPYPPLTTSEIKFLAKLSARLDEEGLTNALSFLIQRKWFDVAVCLIVEREADVNKGALGAAIRSGNISMVTFLLEKGAMPQQNRGTLIDAVKTKNPLIIKLVMENGADVNEMWNSSTPLVEALRLEELDIAEYLLQQGADPNKTYPLEVAIRQKKEDVVRLLLKYGAKLRQ